MTFDTLKSQASRKKFTLFEIYLDINDPALDSEFALQLDSYGTPKTTDDPRAYTGVDFKVYRYADQNVFGVDHFPGLVSVKTNPPKIDPGKSIGFRASGSVTIKDFVTNDSFELNSTYSARDVTGSHFKKMFARNHLYNRRAKIISGYNPNAYDSANTQTQSYLIDGFTYPNQSGEVTFNLVDELILTESKKAVTPNISKGELSAQLSAVATTLSFTTSITEEYGAVSATGYIAIEKEIIAYTVATSTTMTITRAQFGTEAKLHESGETMQLCTYYNNENIIDIITDIITNYTNIPASYIPTADWAALKAGTLASYNLTRLIYKPVEVKKLLNELVTIAGLSMYIDVIENELVIVDVPDFASPVITFDETEHLEMGSVRVKPAEKEQVTRQRIIWDKFAPTEGDEESNYRKKFQVSDLIVENPADTSLTSEGKPLKTEWLINSVDNNSIATNYCQRMVNRFSQVPLEISFEVDQKYINTIAGGRMWLGSVFSVLTNEIVDGGLNPVETTFQCIQIREGRDADKWQVTGLSYVSAAPPNADYYIDTDQTAYTLATDPLFSPILSGAREYIVVINTGVKISSGFTQGTFPGGATLKLINLGGIYGSGGGGGEGGYYEVEEPSYGPAGSGGGGGTALTLTTDVTIDNGFGQIFGGGGGAGGYIGSGTTSGNGGGGGQGSPGGSGGAAGTTQGSSGTAGAAGTIGAPGGNAGAWGSAGANNSATGGAAGTAINSAGNTVTITAGNNSEQIKGAQI